MTTESPGKKFNLGGFARTIGEVGFPMLGGLVAGPAGAAIGEQIAVRLGKRSVAEAEAAIAAKDPAALVALKQVQLEMARAEIDRDVSFDDSVTRRIESVNLTMQAEAAAVVSNPKAGEWRVMWGKWSCVGFWVSVLAMLATSLACVVTDRLDYLVALPAVFGAVMGSFALPAAILGVASWKRGNEKTHLAEGIKSMMQSRAAKEAKPFARAKPLYDGDPSNMEGEIFKG